MPVCMYLLCHHITCIQFKYCTLNGNGKELTTSKQILVDRWSEYYLPPDLSFGVQFGHIDVKNSSFVTYDFTLMHYLYCVKWMSCNNTCWTWKEQVTNIVYICIRVVCIIAWIIWFIGIANSSNNSCISILLTLFQMLYFGIQINNKVIPMCRFASQATQKGHV